MHDPNDSEALFSKLQKLCLLGPQALAQIPNSVFTEAYRTRFSRLEYICTDLREISAMDVDQRGGFRPAFTNMADQLKGLEADYAFLSDEDRSIARIENLGELLRNLRELTTQCAANLR